MEQIVRDVLEGGAGGAGAVVGVEVEEVASAAALSEVVTERRVVFVRVTAPFVAGGVAYATNDVLVWDTMPVPGAWRRIYTEPPQTVVPGAGGGAGGAGGPGGVGPAGGGGPRARGGEAALRLSRGAGRGRPGLRRVVDELDRQVFGTGTVTVAAGLSFTNE